MQTWAFTHYRPDLPKKQGRDMESTPIIMVLQEAQIKLKRLNNSLAESLVIVTKLWPVWLIQEDLWLEALTKKIRVSVKDQMSHTKLKTQQHMEL